MEPEQGNSHDDVQRIAQLLDEMGPQRAQLLAIIDYCRAQERTSDEIDAMLEPYRRHRMSVYTGIAMRSMLERAGALTYISNDENPDEVFDEEGNLVLPDPSVATWIATAAGTACVDAQTPFADLVAALDASTLDARGFALVLSLCRDEQQSISEIAHALEEEGIAHEGTDPTAFVSALEDAGAIEWRGAWQTTQLGARYLSETQRQERA